MKDWKRTVTIGAVFGLFYFAWLFRFMQNWEFDIFNVSHYEYVWSEFLKGWQISAASDWIFIITLISMFPVYLLIWWWLHQFQWKKIAAKIWTEIVIALKGKPKQGHSQKLKDLKPKTSKNTRPRALDTGLARPIPKKEELKVPVAPNEKSPYADSFGNKDVFGSMSQSDSFGNMGGGMNGGAGAAAPRGAMPDMNGFGGMGGGSSFGNFGMGGQPSSFGNFGMSGGADAFGGMGGGSDSFGGMTRGSVGGVPSFMQDDDIANMPLDEIKLPARKRLEEDITDIFKKAGYSVIPSVILDGMPVDYMAISGDKIIMAVLDNEQGDWLADEERFNGEEPLWFSESSHRVSPIFTLLEKIKPFAERVAAMGVALSVQPMLIEQGGSIINAEDMIQIWKDLGVLVARTGNGGPDDLASTAEMVPVADAPAVSDVVETVKNLLA